MASASPGEDGAASEEGELRSMADYKGKVVLVENVASI